MNPAPDNAATIIERALALGPRERSEYVRLACGSDETLLSPSVLLDKVSGEEIAKTIAGIAASTRAPRSDP